MEKSVLVEFGMKKPEYREGRQAGEDFKELATLVPQKPKKAAAPKKMSEGGACGQETELDRHLLPRPCLRVGVR